MYFGTFCAVFGAAFGVLVDNGHLGGTRDDVYENSSVVQSLIRFVLTIAYFLAFIFLAKITEFNSIILTFSLRVVETFAAGALIFILGVPFFRLVRLVD
mmetsp:Transcript_47548/g.34825  ORF Transcript_47548/g.34825 Transcript_47548/m.34825 type:complete len:99 (+) Transcript_47548:414-710(+)